MAAADATSIVACLLFLLAWVSGAPGMSRSLLDFAGGGLPLCYLNSLPAQGWKRCAPSAMRNPLSPVRRGVSNAMTPIEPDRRERRAQRGEPPEQQSAEPESRARDRGVLESQRRPPGANLVGAEAVLKLRVLRSQPRLRCVLELPRRGSTSGTTPSDTLME